MRTVVEAVIRVSHVASPIQRFGTGSRGSRSERSTGIRIRPTPGAYDIKKFRSQGLVQKAGNSSRYEPIPEGLRAMVALVVLRDNVIRPLLAASGKPIPRPKLQNQIRIDRRYENLRDTIRLLSTDLGLVA
jgi:hypothetical protein